ncbi:hypothetical protein PM082_024016 [Marasmius tenuissimus]|nr:hypothetical protein PM082_024016 [Marasmius tenuissimus]
MSSRRPAAHTNPPKFSEEAENIGRGHGASATTMNINDNPFCHTVNGNMHSFIPSTTIRNYQCQHVYENSMIYHGCTVYTGIAHSTREARSDEQAAATQSPMPPHCVEPGFSLMPFYWPWALISSFIRIVIRAASVSSSPHNTLPMNTQSDLEAQIGIYPNMSHDTLSLSTPVLNPRADENV